jgi:hypothetical protein
MKNPSRKHVFFSFRLILLLWTAMDCSAQEVKNDSESDQMTATQLRFGLDASKPLIERVGKTPVSVLAIFRDAGMSPKPFTLDEQNQQKLIDAISILPPLHQSVLKQRLRSISLVTDMPNTALTSAVNPDDSICLFDITIRAGILNQSAADWLVEKESSCFDTEKSSFYLKADVGNLSAIQYVLLHEATHVVDAALEITPAVRSNSGGVMLEHATPFTATVWEDARTPTDRYKDEGLMAIRFRPGGKVLEASQMKSLYEALGRTPFVSLYGSAARTEDLAEYLTVYHLTQVLHQPFQIHVYDGKDLILTHDPMASDIVRGRFELMRQFYQAENLDKSPDKKSTEYRIRTKDILSVLH